MKRLISFIIIMTVALTVTAGLTSAFDVSAADENYVIDFESDAVGAVADSEPAGITAPAVFSQKTSADTGSTVEVIQDGESNKALKITKKSGGNAGALVKFPSAIAGGMYEYSFDLKIDSFCYTMPTSHSFGGSSDDILSSVNDGKYHTFKVVTDLDAGAKSGAYYIDGKYYGTWANSSNYGSFQYADFLLTQDTNSVTTSDGVYYIDNIKLKNISNKIKSVIPANGAEDVLVDSDIKVTYTYPMLRTPNIEIRMNNSVLEADSDYTAVWNDEKTELKILFGRGLSKSKKYDVWIDEALVASFETEKIPFGADNIKAYNDSNQAINSINDVKGKKLTVKADILNNYGAQKEYTAILCFNC